MLEPASYLHHECLVELLNVDTLVLRLNTTCFEDQVHVWLDRGESESLENSDQISCLNYWLFLITDFIHHHCSEENVVNGILRVSQRIINPLEDLVLNHIRKVEPSVSDVRIQLLDELVV